MERKGGNTIPSSPSHTPTDKAVRDLRHTDGNLSGKYDSNNNNNNNNKEKGVNIQVVVRCRPMNGDEEKLHTPMVITCAENKREVCAVQTIANKQIDRSFVFDKKPVEA